MDRWTDGYMDGWIDGQMDRWIDELNRRINGYDDRFENYNYIKLCSWYICGGGGVWVW